MTTALYAPISNLMHDPVRHKVFGDGHAIGWTACGQLVVRFTGGVQAISATDFAWDEPPRAVEPPSPPPAEQPPLIINMAVGYLVVWPSRLMAKWFFRFSSAASAAEQ